MKRRFFKTSLAVAALAMCWIVSAAIGVERLAIEHPFRNPPRFTDHVRCDNCGMDRNKWGRTRHEFSASKSKYHTCSIACVAVMGMKLNEQPSGVMVAEYLKPERMLPADKAFYVVGSSAPGTMTAVSKIAFAAKSEASSFAGRYGGKVV